MDRDTPRVGFIGLGRMGKPMAKNILRAGFPLTVHSRSPEPVEELVGLGAKAAWSPQEVVREAEIVLTCLPGPAEVVEVLTGENGALKLARAGSIFVDHSTIDPETSRHIARVAEKRQAAFLDAPVSGGISGAERGSLTIMVGGPREAYERCCPVLRAIGERIYHLGAVGSGNIAKLCNQVITGVTYAAVAEAVVLGAKAGLNPATLYEILSVSSARSRSLEQAGPIILSGNFDATFTVDLAHKDLECAIVTAKKLAVRLPLATVAQQMYEEARALGLGDKDQAAVVLPLERLVGLAVRTKVE